MSRLVEQFLKEASVGQRRIDQAVDAAYTGVHNYDKEEIEAWLKRKNFHVPGLAEELYKFKIGEMKEVPRGRLGGWQEDHPNWAFNTEKFREIFSKFFGKGSSQKAVGQDKIIKKIISEEWGSNVLRKLSRGGDFYTLIGDVHEWMYEQDLIRDTESEEDCIQRVWEARAENEEEYTKLVDCVSYALGHQGIDTY